MTKKLVLDKKYMARYFACYMLAGILAMVLGAVLSQHTQLFRVAFAATTEESVVLGILKVMKIIGLLAGGILALVGLIKFVLSQSTENGQEQQKAVMMMVSGVALIVIAGLVTTLIPWSTILTDLTEEVSF